MKKILVAISFLFSFCALNAQFNDTSELRQYIDANVQMNRQLRATELKTILYGFLQHVNLGKDVYVQYPLQVYKDDTNDSTKMRIAQTWIDSLLSLIGGGGSPVTLQMAATNGNSISKAYSPSNYTLMKMYNSATPDYGIDYNVSGYEDVMMVNKGVNFNTYVSPYFIKAESPTLNKTATLKYNGLQLDDFDESATATIDVSGIQTNAPYYEFYHNTTGGDIRLILSEIDNSPKIKLYKPGLTDVTISSENITRSDRLFKLPDSVGTGVFRLKSGSTFFNPDSKGTIDVSSLAGGGGSMVYPGAGIPLSTGSAWGTSITNNSANWNTAYGWGNHASAGYLTASSTNTITNKTISGSNNTFSNIPQSAVTNLSSDLAALQWIRVRDTTSATFSNVSSNIECIINPAVVKTAITKTFPASPYDGQMVRFLFGGTINATATSVVNTFTIAPNSGQGVVGSIVFYSVETDDSFTWKWDSTNSKWYRLK